jgi:hypothetical protein
MKFLIPIFALLLLVACRPVRTTQQYYNEYVNPVASIDYEDTISAEIPVEFLDDYYTVDSKIVRLADQLDLLDSRVETSWIEYQKAGQPWIVQIAVLDQDQLFVSGDDALGFDPVARKALADLGPEKTRYFFKDGERVFFVHVVTLPGGQHTSTVVEIDMKALAVEVPDNRTVIAIDDQICGPAIANLSDACMRLQKSTNYSGTLNINDTSWYWIRSMGSDNLVYLHLNQE